MSSVKARRPDEDQHVLFHLGLLMNQIRDELAAGDDPGLRPSHYRVLGHVPAEGVSITELAAMVRMTKQGCGQFVTQLTDSGHLVVEPDPRDARVRLVRRTAVGDDANHGLSKRLAEVEAGWSSLVGERRYRTFRRVLEELAGRG